MRSRRVGKLGKLTRIIYGPIRVLGRAWDSYLRSASGLAGPVAYCNAVGCPIAHIPTVYSSYTTTVDDELRDLVRLATARRLAGKFDAPGFHRPKSVVPIGGGGATTTAFELGRIDEETEV